MRKTQIRQHCRFPGRKARAAILMAFVMTVSDCLPGFAAASVNTFGESISTAFSVRKESAQEEENRQATGSDAEFIEETNFFGDLAAGTFGERSAVIKEGQYADAFWWSLDRDGLLTIRGEGDLPGTYRPYELPWYSVRASVKKIIFEEGVTGIGEYLFSDCTNLASLEIPDTVTHIGEHAFYRCAKLRDVIMPDTVDTIDAGAFDGCPLLPKEMAVCRGRLTADVWWKMDGKGTLTVGGEGPVPDGKNWSDFPWFSAAASVREIVVEEGITAIGAHAFDNCENVSAVSLPDGIQSIGEYAFRFCKNLTAIEIPGTVTKISQYAFSSCSNLAHAAIPDSVTTIEGGAFSGCSSLAEDTPVARDTYSEHLRWVVTAGGVMTVSGDGEIPDMGGAYIEGENQEPYKGNWNTLWISIEDSIREIIIEEGITAIGKSAFGSCKNLVSLKLPDSLRKIGDNAFNYCLKLADVKLPAGLRHIGRGAFTDTSVTSAVIPGDVDYLSQAAFPDGTDLTYEKTADPERTPLEETGNSGFAASGNAHHQNYAIWPIRKVESCLWTGEDGNLFRTEYLSAKKQVIMEEYSPDQELAGSWVIPMELPLFGGFYQDGGEFYVVFGQRNMEERDDAEIIRIVRYNKDMERLDSVSLYGMDTTIPFEAGSLRMDKKGPYLYIHTAHQKYQSPADGRRHQENMTIIVNTEAMAVALADHGRWDTYVSHSFNQFVKVDGDFMVTVDQGDSLPERAVILACFQADDVGAAPAVRRKLMNIGGEDGANYTGVTLGGLEVSDQCYLTAGSSIDQRNFSDSYALNVFLSVIEKNDLEGRGKFIQVTDYREGGEYCAGTPQLVKISDDLFVLMWEEIKAYDFKYYRTMEPTGTVKAAFFDGEGNQLWSGSFEGSLSDCQPILYRDQVVWYVTDDSGLTFYGFGAECPDQASDLQVSKVLLEGEKTGGDGGDTEGGNGTGSGGDTEGGGNGTGSGGDTEGGGNETGSGGDTEDGGNGAGNGTGGSGSGGAGEGTGGDESGEGTGGSAGGDGTGSGTGDSGSTGGTGQGTGGSGSEGDSGNSGDGNTGGSQGSGGSGTGGIGTGGIGIGGSEGGSGSGGSGGTGGGSSSGGSGGSGGGSSSGGGGGSGGGSGSGGGPGGSKGGTVSGTPGTAPSSNTPETASVLTGTWRRDGRGWWLEKPDKSYPRSQWARINGMVYHFDDAGYMSEGWLLLNGRWYYLVPGSGAMAAGWAWVSDRWYYLNPDGAMATGWICLSGTWYYLNADGAMATGWLCLSGTWYYLNADGAMAAGWICVADKWYYLNPDGAMLASTTTPDGYVVGADGAWIQ